jgi:Flp pilus assembly pilin Flp
MKKIFNSRDFGRNQDGIAAIEFAFIFPIMILMFFGLVDLTNLISTSRKVTNASSLIADMVGQNGAAFPKSVLEDYKRAAHMIIPGKADNEIRVDISAYRMVSGTAQRVWYLKSAEGPQCVSEVSKTNMPALMTGPNDLIVAQVCVVYKPLKNFLSNSPLLGSPSINVLETTITRPRVRDIIECTNCPTT